MLSTSYGTQCTWSEVDIQCKTRDSLLNMSKNHYVKL